MIQILQIIGAVCFTIAGVGMLIGRGGGEKVKHRVPLGILCLILAAFNLFLAIRL